MKKSKILVPALAMLVMSTAATVTGTVAWFSMNTAVSATGMKVQAKSEAGLLISADKTEASWADTDETAYTTSVSLAPASTNNFTNWYHSQSSSAAASTSTGAYTTLATSGSTGVTIVKTTNMASGDAVANITYADSNGDDAYVAANDVGYYLQTSFFVKSSGDQIAVDQSAKYLAISKVSVSGINSTDGSAELDKALRVGVVIGTAKTIMAPLAGATGTYNVNGATATKAYVGTLTGSSSPAEYAADVDTEWTGNIPAKTTSAPLEVKIYVWFEGEDAACKSNNIVETLDTLTVGVTFALQDTQPTNHVSA